MLARLICVNVGSPTGRESYGDGVPIVVVGVTTHLGGCDTKQLQGEGAALAGGPELAWVEPGRQDRYRDVQDRRGMRNAEC